MKCLSVRQPWASLIATGRKTVELRSWNTKYRGPLLILSGANIWRGVHGHPTGPLGVTMCTVDLVAVRPSSIGDTDAACITPSDGYDFAWVLTNARPVQQIPVKGKLGLYAADPELLRALCLSV